MTMAVKKTQIKYPRKELEQLDSSNSKLITLAMTAMRIATATTSNLTSESIKTIQMKTNFDENGNENASLREISLDEISYHDSPSDCWLIIYDRVYDVTDFLKLHPGGDDIVLEYAGRDATFAFRGKGHTTAAINSLKLYEIGKLPEHEMIFRNKTGFKLSDIPI